MIPNLPRPLLWTEIKTMTEFENGGFFAWAFYQVFKQIKAETNFPFVDEVTFFNELFYQLTRYHYERPNSNGYQHYYADIRTHLGKVECADLVMVMMFHYCRLRDHQFLFKMNSFMGRIQFLHRGGVYWQYFVTTRITGFQPVDYVPYPKKPCPVPPEKLVKVELDWKKLTQDFNPSVLREIVELWEKEEDREVVKNYLNQMNGKKVNKGKSEVYDAEKRCVNLDAFVEKKMKELKEEKHEEAYNAKTGLPCFTNRQMGILLLAVAEMTEAPNPPAKTTLGEVVEKIAGYKATTVNQNMKGKFSEKDKQIIMAALKDKMPNLAEKVGKL